MIGRFPIYTSEIFNDHEEKWQYVLKLIKDINEAIYEFVLNAPDGTLRVMGPVRTKHGNCLVLSSPLPALFRFFILNLPNELKSSFRSDNPFFEWTLTKELFTPPSTYILKIYDADVISFKQLISDFSMFLGINIKPKYLFASMKVDRTNTYITIRTLNEDASALMKFSRYAGFGENRKYGFGDVEVFEVGEE
ncbi:hypothetical protein [Pseudothermotoga sp.]|nr:hypothetical protein [Pseudothermotoga sp.]MCX7812494.1 hypothetical protein [Pseudothermotoga sp.]MDW8140050.1 hypothetical protein [Pseudothermotoga sp.]